MNKASQTGPISGQYTWYVDFSQTMSRTEGKSLKTTPIIDFTEFDRSSANGNRTNSPTESLT